MTDQEGTQVARVVWWRSIVAGQENWGSLSRVERREGWKQGGLPILGWGTGFKAGDIVSDWGERDILAGPLVLEPGNSPRVIVRGVGNRGNSESEGGSLGLKVRNRSGVVA